MSNTLTLSRGKIDTNHRLGTINSWNALLRISSHNKAIDTLNKENSHQIKPGDTLDQVAKNLGISKNVFAASLMKAPYDLVPAHWENMSISYANGMVRLENGTQFPVVPSHLRAANDASFRQAA